VWEIELSHNFETAHRLNAPGSPVKCMSIHGHSWWVTVRIQGPTLDGMDMLVEFGRFKAAWRRWLDDEVDHHLVLHREDPMVGAVRSVYPESRLLLLDRSPTTEILAEEIFRRSAAILADMVPASHAWVEKVHVQETRANAASFRRSKDAGGSLAG
jgi:6-pyruvoyltetrahydropterin/6-carboxytetrahydropterin synthase